jgi:hypothetical protein
VSQDRTVIIHYLCVFSVQDRTANEVIICVFSTEVDGEDEVLSGDADRDA